MRRGWVVCQEKSIIKYHQVYGTTRRFVLAIHLWLQHCLDTDEDRAALLAFWPSDADVDAAVPNAVLVDF